MEVSVRFWVGLQTYTIMEEELYNWLEREFYRSNHTKYFKEWITNILPHQIEGFRNQMVGQITKSKVI